MAGDMKGFVPDEWVAGSTVVILAQNPGANEEREGRPMCGRTGELMDTAFIPLANLERGKNVSVANILKCRWTDQGKKVDALPTGEVYDQAVAHCTGAHLHIPESITHIVLQGKHALNWGAAPTATLLGEPLAMGQWRGHSIRDHRFGPTRHVYAVEHLASVMRDPKLWWVTELDWRKVDAWANGYWPDPIPPYLPYGTATWQEGEQWFASARQGARYLVIDTEYVGGGHPATPGFLTYCGLGYRDTTGVHGLQINWEAAPPWLRQRFSDQLRSLVKTVPTVFQNFAADMPVLRKHCGIAYDQYIKIHDTMLSHAILYCELPHSLEFQASIYGRYPKLKHLAVVDTPLYNWGDVIETMAMFEGHQRGFQADKAAEQVYITQSLALIPLLLDSMGAGLFVNQGRVLQAKEEYEQKVRQAVALAQVYVGWPINLGSDDQVKYYAYTERGYPVQVDKETGRPTLDQDALATLRDLIGPSVLQGTDQEGLTIERAIERIEQGGDPVLEARTLYMEYQHVLDAYIYSLHRAVVNATTDGERKRAREKAKGVGWTGTDVVRRVYPTFAIHAQKTGRWSTSDPPLAQLPKALRDLFCPDPGHVWIHWDWKGIELQFLEVHSGSEILKAAHDEGLDIHTWTTCAIFGYEFPPNLVDPHKAPECQAWRERYKWGGKDDPRRIFSKGARYELCVPLDSRILTRDGWRHHDEVQQGETVLVYNAETKQKEWGTLLDKVYYDDAPLLSFGSKSWQVTATPAHRWFVRKRTWQGRRWATPYMQKESVRQTQDLNTECNIVVNAPMSKDPGLPTNLVQPKYGTDWTREVCRMSTDQREAFIRGFALADGHQHAGRWLIDQKDGPLWDAILTACYIHNGTHITTCNCDSRNGVKRLGIGCKPHVTMQLAKLKDAGRQRVWCPITSHGSWVMRQGDVITITGNCYGGRGATAAEKAVRMGLDKTVVKAATARLLTSDTKYYAWRTRLEEEVRRTRILRTFSGRPRRFLGVSKSSSKVPPKVVREALDYQMQGGVSDVFNRVAVQIRATLGLLFVFGMHDSQFWSIPSKNLTQPLLDTLKRIVQQPFCIEGKTKCFPADFGIIPHPGEPLPEGVTI